MALIACPECTKEISDKALSCPHCGNPAVSLPAVDEGPTIVTDAQGHAMMIETPTRVATARGDAITTEATGKGPKLLQLIGGLMFGVGLIAQFGGFSPVMAVIALIGLGVHIIGRASAWWSHG